VRPWTGILSENQVLIGYADWAICVESIATDTAGARHYTSHVPSPDRGFGLRISWSREDRVFPFWGFLARADVDTVWDPHRRSQLQIFNILTCKYSTSNIASHLAIIVNDRGLEKAETQLNCSLDGKIYVLRLQRSIYFSTSLAHSMIWNLNLLIHTSYSKYP